MNFETFELLLEMILGFSFIIIIIIVTLKVIDFMNKRDERKNENIGGI